MKLRALLLLTVFLGHAGRASAAQFIASSNPADVFYSIGMASNGVVRISGARNDEPGFFTLDGSDLIFTPLAPLLPGGWASSYRISVDGTRIVGYSESPETVVGYEAVLWNVTTPSAPLALGFLTPYPASKDSIAFGISADGAVFGGANSVSHGATGFRWTVADGMIELGRTGLPTTSSLAAGVSTNGSIWCGFEDPSGPKTFRAVVGDLFGVKALDALGNSYSDAVNISRDGKVVVGNIGEQAAFWSGTNYAPTLLTLDSAPLLGQAAAAEAGWVVGLGYRETGGNFGWVASLTNGISQTASNWLAQQYGLSVTNNITDAMDILQSGNRLFIVFNTTTGGALFTTELPPPAPTLAISLLPPNQVQLRWPTNRLCTLESTPNLNPPRVWTALTNPAPALSNGQFILPLPATNAAQFFRLNYP